MPDDGCLVQPKHVAFYITITKCCVMKDCFTVAYFINKPGKTQIKTFL